ncbi:MAG: DnaA family protein [Oceanicoccus sp.]|jgi:DnaA family protein
MSFLFEQFPLAIQLRDDATFDNFYPGDNGLLLATLRQQLEGGERYNFIFGAEGSGRSHLLQAGCHHADVLGLSAVYLPLAELLDYPPQELFEGLENLSLVCIDDLQAVIGHDDWELQLFNLFNRLQQHNVPLLIAAATAVRELSVVLPDLASRLSWGAVFALVPLSDEQRQELIQRRAKQRGLELSDDVVQFMYHRCQRDTKALLAVLDTLDHASLKLQRRLTVPFVKQIMDW